MNIWGHEQAIKSLRKHKEFWKEIAQIAYHKNFSTEEHVCQSFAKGEGKKIDWHNNEIHVLRNRKEAPDTRKEFTKNKMPPRG